MDSLKHVFIFFGAFLIWATRLFRGRFDELITHDKDYLNFFLKTWHIIDNSNIDR